MTTTPDHEPDLRALDTTDDDPDATVGAPVEPEHDLDPADFATPTEDEL